MKSATLTQKTPVRGRGRPTPEGRTGKATAQLKTTLPEVEKQLLTEFLDSKGMSFPEWLLMHLEGDISKLGKDYKAELRRLQSSTTIAA